MITLTNVFRILSTCAVVCLIVLSGCQKNEQTDNETTGSTFETIQPTVDPDVIAEEDRVITVEEMREALGANENAHFEKTGRKFSVASLTNSGVKTIDPLKGQPLKAIDLTQTRITDLSALEGMPLEMIGMAETDISDISTLQGMPLRHIDGTRSKIEDISSLSGMKQLSHLFFEGAKIKDLSPLQGLPLKVVLLNACPIEDFSPLQGMTLEQLNLCDTPLQNLDVLSTTQIGTLWIRNTSVNELTPIANHRLVSLDIQGTPINKLDALAGMTTLKRLNIAETEVKDLSPLKGLQLERIIFSPSKITAGIDAIREMPSLQGIDLSFDGVAQPMNPSIFWEKYDAGEFKAKTE